jgi:outer membrane protein assembly factor BamB
MGQIEGHPDRSTQQAEFTGAIEMRFTATAIGFLALASAALADDWPQWLGPKRDAIWRETGIIDTLAADVVRVRWRAPVAAGYAGPAVAAGRVFVHDRVLAEGAKNHSEPFPQRPRQGIPGIERILCFNEADGQLVWKHEYDCPYTVSYPLGPRCTPTVHGGKVYTLGAEGNLLCLDAVDGKVVWSRELKKDYEVKAPLWGFSSHPLIDGQKLITLVGGDGSVAVAFDIDTGRELWRALSAMQPGYCAPMICTINGQRQVIIWHSEAVNGLDPETGKVLWTQPTETYQGMSISTPLVFGDRVFVTGYPKTAVAVQIKNGATEPDVVWKGDPKKKNAFYSVFSTPFYEDGHIYGVNGTISDGGGVLCCIKADTGERLWETLQPHGPKRLGSAELFLTKNGDRFFITNEKGDLIIARLSPKGYEEISRTHLLDATSSAFGRDVLWSPPAFANRSIYVRNDKELLCVSLSN